MAGGDQAGPGAGGAAGAPSKRDIRSDYLIAGGATVVAVLFVFRRAVEGQLARLVAPGAKSYSYSDLHGRSVRDAFRGWRAGKDDLNAFEPVAAGNLVLQRTGVSTALTVLTALLLVMLLRRLQNEHKHRKTARRLYPVVVLFAVSSFAVVLVDLAIVANEESAPTLYAPLFPWLVWIPLVCLGVIASALAGRSLADIRGRWAVYRASPASARLALGVALGFAILCNLGSIGAQLEDHLRRELVTGKAGSELAGAFVLLGALAVYVFVLKMLGELDFKPGDPPDPTTTALIGLAIVVACLAALWFVDAQSAPLVLGAMVLVLGVLSCLMKGEPAPARRRQLELRVGIVLVVAGMAAVVFGLRLGQARHGGFLTFGVGSVAGVGLIAIIVRLVRRRRPAAEEIPEPAGPEAAAVLILLGILLMVVLHDRRVWAGGAAALAALGGVLHLWARRSFQTTCPALDAPGVALLAAGVALVHAHPAGPAVLPGWLPGNPAQLPGRGWVIGAALVLGGLVWLRVNRGDYVTVPWLVGAPEKTIVGDADPTGVLVLAGVLPVAGLLTISVRVLAGALATGQRVPVVLGAFQAVLVAAVVAGGWYITTSAGQSGWIQSVAHRAETVVRRTVGRHGQVRPVPLAALLVVAAALPLFAVLSMGGRTTAMVVGRFLGPLALLVLMLASLAAAAGLLRFAFRGADPLDVFRYLGIRRTPVIGLLLTWLVLIMAVGAPIERLAASSHNARLLVRTAGALEPPSCPDDDGVMEALTQARIVGPNPVAQELCRWVDDVLDQREKGRLPNSEALPLILVTASGGGVRAAAWTMLVLDCLLFENSSGTGCGTGRGAPSPVREALWPYVFAAGGASGGSVGIASAAAQWLAPVRDSAEGAHRWWRHVAEPDHVAPVAGQLLLAETGLAPLGAVPEYDRAETLIDSWGNPFGPLDDPSDKCPRLSEDVKIQDVGFLEVAATCSGDVPMLLFNGTIVRTGGRFDISPLDAPGHDGALGLRDVLCRQPENRAQDIPFFDAAFLSARFPLVTPSGRLGYVRPPGCVPDVSSPVDVVDAGYHENSGAAQISDLWAELGPMVRALNEHSNGSRPQIRPILLQIENGEVKEKTSLGCLPEVAPRRSMAFLGTADPGTTPTKAVEKDRAVRFGEPLRILWAGFQTSIRNVKEPHVMKRLSRSLCKDGIPVVTMALYQHPGRALPLGWSLTDDVLNDLSSVFALEPNACRARAFAGYVHAGASAAGRWSCGPPGRTKS